MPDGLNERVASGHQAPPTEQGPIPTSILRSSTSHAGYRYQHVHRPVYMLHKHRPPWPRIHANRRIAPFRGERYQDQCGRVAEAGPSERAHSRIESLGQWVDQV